MSHFRGLFIADIHMNNRLPFAKPTENGRTDRLDDQLRLWKQVGNVALKQDVDRVFILGDLFDQSRVDAITLTESSGAIEQVSRKKPVSIMAGNHDAVSTKGGRFTVEAFGALNLGRISYLEYRPEGWDFGGPVKFWPVPYATIPETQQQLQAIRERIAGQRGHNVALLHNSILGCGHEGWICDDGLTPEEATEGFTYTIAGHFHTTQEFADGKGMYCGSPLHFRFDDRHRQAGFWVIDFDSDGSVERRFFQTNLPSFHVTSWPELVIPDSIKEGDYLKIEVDVTHAEWTAIKPKVTEYAESWIEQGMRVQVKHKPLYHHTERISKGKLTKMSLPEMTSHYVDAVEVDTSGLDKAKLKELGRRAIEEVRRSKAS